APGSIDGRADLYALGAVGYFLLVGAPVFEGHTVVEVCGMHLHAQPVRPSMRVATPIPEGLERVILRCLSKKPEDRPASADELARELRALNDVPDWSKEDAENWWAEHMNPSVEAATPAPPTTTPATKAPIATVPALTVDLRAR